MGHSAPNKGALRRSLIFMQALWMLVAALLFSIMGVGVKFSSSYFSTAEIVAWRGWIGVLLLFSFAYWRKLTLQTRMPTTHFSRGLVGVGSLWLWYYAIAGMPLALAVTLNYLSPVWLVAIVLGLRWWRYNRLPHWAAPCAILLGFLGVVCVLHPDAPQQHAHYAIAALISSVFAALAYLQVRQMGKAGEPEYRVVFYFSLSCAIAGTLVAVIHNQRPALEAIPPGAWLWLLLTGCSAAGAQVAMTRAYRLGNPIVAASLHYTGIIFSCGWDMLIWHAQPDLLSYLGIAIILCSGLLASYSNHRSTQEDKHVSDSDRQ